MRFEEGLNRFLDKLKHILNLFDSNLKLRLVSVEMERFVLILVYSKMYKPADMGIKYLIILILALQNLKSNLIGSAYMK